MRQTPQGVRQLAQALKDFAAGRSIRALDESGQIKQLSDSSGEQMVTDNFLREEFPPAGKARAPRQGDTPTDHFNNRVSDLARAMEKLNEAFLVVAAVVGHDERPMVDTAGVDRKLCNIWRDQLNQLDEELVIWGRTFQRLYASSAQSVGSSFQAEDDDQPEAEVDVYAEAENWEADQSTTLTNG